MNKIYCLVCFVALPMAAHAAPRVNDFPTVDRVLYVHECMVAHPDIGHFEITNKCACAIDAIASEITYDEYVQLSTASKATTIGGERGSYIRDVEALQAGIKRYRALQAKTNKACFIGPPTAR
jgi:hypothetical protein